MEDMDLRAVDRPLLFDRIEELEDLVADVAPEDDPEEIAAYVEELETYHWIQDMLYLIDEGFIAQLDDGRLIHTDVSCPSSL